jgi:hypothetical protein
MILKLKLKMKIRFICNPKLIYRLVIYRLVSNKNCDKEDIHNSEDEVVSDANVSGCVGSIDNQNNTEETLTCVNTTNSIDNSTTDVSTTTRAVSYAEANLWAVGHGLQYMECVSTIAAADSTNDNTDTNNVQ